MRFAHEASEGGGGAPLDLPDGGGGAPLDLPEGGGGAPLDLPEGGAGAPSLPSLDLRRLCRESFFESFFFPCFSRFSLGKFLYPKLRIQELEYGSDLPRDFLRSNCNRVTLWTLFMAPAKPRMNLAVYESLMPENLLEKMRNSRGLKVVPSFIILALNTSCSSQSALAISSSKNPMAFKTTI